MTNEKKQAVKRELKQAGKAIWEALPLVLWAIGLTCWLMLPILYVGESGELEAKISALQAENTRYETEQTYLIGEIEWLRSRIGEGAEVCGN